MQGSKRVIAAAVVAVAGQLIGSSTSKAANIVWDGGGADSSVLTPANWVGDVLPAVTDAAQFNGTVRTDPFAPTDVQYLSLFFLAGATSPFTVSGPGAITLGSTTAGNYLNNDTVGVTHTINANVNMIGGTINATQGGLVFGGTLNIGNNANAVNGNLVTINAPGNATTGIFNNVTLNGIAGTGTATSGTSGSGLGGALTKNGIGNLFVNGVNSAWAGNVFINGGNVRINNAAALGTGGGRIETALTSGGTGLGTLELAGGDYTLTKPVTVRARQAPTINEVSLRNVENNHTISNVTTGSGGNSFNFESAAGNFTLDSINATASTGGRGVRLLGAGNGAINNLTQPTGASYAITKDGTGTWTLGTNLNGMSGVFGRALSGSLVLMGGNAITVNGGNLVLGTDLGQKVLGDVLVNNGGTLTIQSSNGQIGEVGTSPAAGTTTILNIQQGGTLDASQFSVYNLQIGQTVIGGGTFKVGGQLSTFGDNAVHIGNATTPQAGTFNIQGNLSVSNVAATATGGFRFDLSNSAAGTNDRVAIQGGLIVDNSSGPIPLYINSLGGGFGSGTYHLFEFTSGATLNASDFAIVGGLSATTRQAFSVGTAPGQVNLVVSGNAGNLVWNGTASSNTWEVSPVQTWLNNGSPDRFFDGDIVSFTDAAANKTVNIAGTVQPISIAVNTSGNYTFTGSGVIGGGSATLTKDGTGSLTINNSSLNTYAGGTTLNAGTLNAAVSSALGAGGVTVNGGQLNLNNPTAITTSLTITGGAIGNTSGNALTMNSNITQSWNGDFSFAGPNDLNMGTGTVTLGGAGTDRTVTVGSGTFAAGELKSTTHGLVKQGAGTIAFASTGAGAAASVISGTLNVAAGTVQINATGTLAEATGDLTVSGLTGTGTITNGSETERWVFVNTAGTHTFAGTLANGGTGGLGLNKQGVGTLSLTGSANTHSGATTVEGGILSIENSGALGTSTVTLRSRAGGMHLSGGISLPAAVNFRTSNDGTGTVPYALSNVSGDNTINGTITMTDGGGNTIIRAEGGSLTLAGNVTSDRARVLILEGASAAANTVSGVISDGTAGTNALLKRGAGTWSLTGANTYTGGSTVQAGTLVYGTVAQGPVFGAGGQGIDVQGGKAAFKYIDTAAGEATASNVLAILNAGYDLSPQFSTGTIRSTTVALQANRILGWRNNVASQQVEVAFTVPGDANLDFTVGFPDLVALAQNYNATNGVWSQGDFNYDQAVGFADLVILAQQYNQSLTAVESAQLGASFAADYAMALSLVPEPGTMSVIGLGLAAFGRRVRTARRA